MEEITTTGIVVGGEDSGEADRIVRLLTPSGVISVRMRGVKKEKAKLKFAAMPFSFCRYVLLKRGGFYSVKTADQEESLFGVTSSPEKYITGSLMLETAAVASGGSDSADIFISLLTSLKDLIYSDVHPYIAGLSFICDLLVRGGHLTRSVASAASDGDLTVPLARTRLKGYASLFEKKYYTKLKSLPMI